MSESRSIWCIYAYFFIEICNLTRVSKSIIRLLYWNVLWIKIHQDLHKPLMSRLSSSSVAISPSLFASTKWSDSFSLIEKEIVLKVSTYMGKKFFRRKVECKSSACIFLQVMMLFEESCTYKQHHNNKEYNHSEEGQKRCKLTPNSNSAKSCHKRGNLL